MEPGSIRVNEYNLFNELVATNANGNYAAYAYNTNGIRTAKSVNGTCTSFLLDGGNVVSSFTEAKIENELEQKPILSNNKTVLHRTRFLLAY